MNEIAALYLLLVAVVPSYFSPTIAWSPGDAAAGCDGPCKWTLPQHIGSSSRAVPSPRRLHDSLWNINRVLPKGSSSSSSSSEDGPTSTSTDNQNEAEKSQHSWWYRVGSRKYDALHGSAGRRGADALLTTSTATLGQDEILILSGGFTEHDFESFSVWSYNITAGLAPPSLQEEENRHDDDDDPSLWVDLSGLGIGSASKHANHKSWSGTTKQNTPPNNGTQDTADLIWPHGRMGHLSSIHNGYLHIFGGLIWKGHGDDFYTEEEVVIWRAYIADRFSGQDKGPLQWEQVTPSIITYPEKYSTSEDSDSDNNVNNSVPLKDDALDYEDTEGDAVDEEGEEDTENGGRVILQQEKLSTTHHRERVGRKQKSSSSSMSPSEFSFLPRGEAQGGTWCPVPDDPQSCVWVIYGGLHIGQQPNPHPYSQFSQHDDMMPVKDPLGDVWIYNYTSGTLEQLAPFPPDPRQYDFQSDSYFPDARTFHAATVVGNELIVHGGMAIVTETTNSWNSMEDTRWEALSDVWVFDLVNLKWKERNTVPLMARSYHSLVGRDDGSIAIYGGFREAQTVAGQNVAFVFSDTLVLHPNDPKWLKAETPQLGHMSEGPANRLEHSAVLDKSGTMIVWGGRFQHVVEGMWALDVFNDNSAVSFIEAPPDGLEAYEAELEVLHLLVAFMFFMSIMFTSIHGAIRRREENAGPGGATNNNNGSGGGFLGTRRGLSRATIDALPVKTYTTSSSTSDDSTTLTSESSFSDETIQTHEGSGLGREKEDGDALHTEENECCPICLVEYENGDELRCLPCNHGFHTECLDPWLQNNRSCPACRHALSDSFLPSNNDEQEPVANAFTPDVRNFDRVEPIPISNMMSLPRFLGGRERRWFGLLQNTEEDQDDFDSSSTENTRSSRRRSRRSRRLRSARIARATPSITEMVTLGDTEMV
mmetsp:Transcript_21538/g.38966  ORF Transcript_21538/g.38966 Transcript_21538/m.38966 type:complete len:932 (-) Transcript_21538:1447-4242(-)